MVANKEIKIVTPKFIDCTANNYDNSKPCLPLIIYGKPLRSNNNNNKPRYRIMIAPQKQIWDLLRARDYDEIENTKYFCYTIGNHKSVEEIEQWVLQYYDELEESKQITDLK